MAKIKARRIKVKITKKERESLLRRFTRAVENETKIREVSRA